MFFSSTDVDECKRDVNLCDKNALCTNTDGSYKCSCKGGYRGNGENCSGNGIEKVGGKWGHWNTTNKIILNLSLSVCLFSSVCYLPLHLISA